MVVHFIETGQEVFFLVVLVNDMEGASRSQVSLVGVIVEGTHSTVVFEQSQLVITVFRRILQINGKFAI